MCDDVETATANGLWLLLLALLNADATAWRAAACPCCCCCCCVVCWSNRAYCACSWAAVVSAEEADCAVFEGIGGKKLETGAVEGRDLLLMLFAFPLPEAEFDEVGVVLILCSYTRQVKFC